MDDDDLNCLREAVANAARGCTDHALLDLVYKIIVSEA
jgi:hypothetical protein